MTAARPAPDPTLRGRAPEHQALSGLLTAAARGAGGAVVVHGDAGIGKSALVQDVVARAQGARCLRVDGAEFEMELPYGALHQLCSPVLDLADRLPPPQRAALEAVFGLRQDAPPNPFLLALAVLGLLVEASRAVPLVCLVEDAQWADSASTRALGFAARRIEAERIAFVFVLRDPASVPPLAGLPRLPLAGLADPDARALLEAEVHGPLDEEFRDRIVAEARGNPLALLELPRFAGPVGLAGGFGGLPVRPVAGVLEEGFAARLAALPDHPRALLVLAAAEPLGDPDLLRRSAAALGIDPGAAEVDGLLTVGPKVRFRHPLVRSAAYRTASAGERRRAHAALAEATDAGRDPDRRAWHRAAAAAVPDEDVAAELEHSADRARARGGLAAAAAFLRRAAELSPDRDRRVDRLLAAAGTTLHAGAPEAALGLVQDAGSPDGDRGASARLLRAQAGFLLRRDADATAALLDAAGDQAPEPARETYLDAFSSTMFIDRLPGRLQALARDIRERAPERTPPRPVDLLLDALVEQATRPGGEPVAAMRRAVTAFRDDSSGDPRWMELATLLSIDLYDDGAMRELADRQVHLARRQGALSVLPLALNLQAIARVVAGDPAAAATGLAGAHAIEASTGSVGLASGEFILAAWRGDRPRLDGLAEAMYAAAGRQEVGAELYARAVLGNGLGDYEGALDAAQRARHQEELGSYVGWQLGPELVEAAARAGRPEDAAAVLGTVVARARAAGTDWAIGVELQCRALLADDPDAGTLYEEAIARLTGTGAGAVLARSRLLYGEWLRRRGRRVEARVQLRAAHEALSAMGLAGFAGRAATELLATGEHAQRRGEDRRESLTAQESVIARRVAAGATSKEIAAELFLSPRTIDAHLRNIFRKLEVTSRRQLRSMRL